MHLPSLDYFSYLKYSLGPILAKHSRPFSVNLESAASETVLWECLMAFWKSGIELFGMWDLPQSHAKSTPMMACIFFSGGSELSLGVQREHFGYFSQGTYFPSFSKRNRLACLRRGSMSASLDHYFNITSRSPYTYIIKLALSLVYEYDYNN